MKKLTMLLIVSGFLFFSQSIHAEEKKPRDRDLIALKAYLISLEDFDDETVDLGRHAENVEKYIKMIENTPIPKRQEKINQIKKMVEESTARRKRARNIERFEIELTQNGLLSDSQKKYYIDRSKETVDAIELEELKREVVNLENKINQDHKFVELYLKAIDSFDKIHKDMRKYYAEELANIWLNSKNFEGQVVPYFEKIEAEHVRKGGKAWKRPQNEGVVDIVDSEIDVSDQREDEAFQKFLESKTKISKEMRDHYLNRVKSKKGEAKHHEIDVVKKILEDEERRIEFLNRKKTLSDDLNNSFKFLTSNDYNKLLSLINYSHTTHDLDAIRVQATTLNQERQLFLNNTERLRQQIQKSSKITDKNKQSLINKLDRAFSNRSDLEVNQIIQEFKVLESKLRAVQQRPKKDNSVILKPNPKPNKIEKHRQGWQGEKGKSSYRDKTLELIKGRWETISGSRYYFDNLGKPLSGFVSIANNKFYIDQEKGMVTGWKKISNKWYYFSPVGSLNRQWKAIKGVWYYFDSNSEMVTGWQKIADKWYYFENSGAMAKGWKKINQKWYYLEKSGSMVTSWKKIQNKWYYLEASGAMATGWKKLNNKWYYLDQSGAMVTGWKYLNNQWYYLKDNGQMMAGKAIINNKTYYFDTQGALKK